MTEFKPKIIAFLCSWCSYAGADKAGGQKLRYPANILVVRVMCTGRVDPRFVLKAFREGADGVMVLGCHTGDCHYRNGNMKAMKRMRLLSRMLPQFGIVKERLMFNRVSGGESELFQKLATEMTENITLMGPLKIEGFVKTEGAL